MEFLHGVGVFEMLVVGFVALLLFGKNLPSIAKNLGRTFTELRNRL